ncbi:hypothetical protein VOLCADRAFT_88213 [Volvox carteri f. nagariensis]|uniref:Uncharacterized protein n=1 Tax=Volvox carteri f. nagariensis TaxID=3068 RepID=D8TNK8_VOLCA|nr:uncharacterized protein VOLCADRAFT_88213 [Volvox carteri f. nagariensis]EFJ50861.1 hypothetical protein VOLCADRAFT_88213 [Volvox carteri f. nagariensis]|eukprot:XP_002947873.1 hypothetical protein VOLCADRAFT_88213 [Volvox carteri f. nagariensis]
MTDRDGHRLGGRRPLYASYGFAFAILLLLLRPLPACSQQFSFDLFDNLLANMSPPGSSKKNNGNNGNNENGNNIHNNKEPGAPPTRRLTLQGAMDHLRQFTDPLIFGGDVRGSGGGFRRSGSGHATDGGSSGVGVGGSGGGPFFGFGGFRNSGGFGGLGSLGAFRGGRVGPVGGPRGGSLDFDPDSLRKSTEPLTGDEFQKFLDTISANVNSAAITSAAFNLASGTVYTVSGALSTASVALSLVPAIPNLFFGLFNLEVQAVSFLQDLQDNFQGLFLDELTNVLASVNALRERIRSGKSPRRACEKHTRRFIQMLETQLEQIRTVRALLKDLQENNPIAAALQRSGSSLQQAGADAAAGNLREAAGDLQAAQEAHQEAQDKFDEVTTAVIALAMGG